MVKRRIIAIETSHDDTSVVLYENKQILKEVAFTQTEFHKQFGGTVPEYAARGHYHNLLLALSKFDLKHDFKNIYAIAYTSHPGLIGSLHMGKLFAQALALFLDVPLKPINHMHGHVFAAAFNHLIKFPALALIVSGGHTQLWWVQSYQKLTLIGQTKDDAIGEVYDKIARKMHIGFPGGPPLDQAAQVGQPIYDFSLRDDQTYNFSFSGLKTKVFQKIDQVKHEQNYVANIARSFQDAVIKNLKDKTMRAIKQYRPAAIILGGGVAANSQLRKAFQTWHPQALIPDHKYTTDNAMMIAITADMQEQHD